MSGAPVLDGVVREAIRQRESPAARAPYRLDPLTPAEIATWDELIGNCQGREVFHCNAWLDYLAASRGVEILRWAIRDGDDTVGYFCGGLVRLGPFRILGSPLRSWSTNFMGPVAQESLDQTRFLAALDLLAREKNLAVIELEHLALSEHVLQSAGYERLQNWTYLVPLFPGDPGRMWRALDSTCRNRIRKAETANLSIEDTDDPGIVDEFYEFFLDLMRRKGMRPPFRRETLHLLFAHLRHDARVLALRVRDASGRVLAVGIFPHDDNTIYFWSGASHRDAHSLCPNDLLHWTAMRMAAERGLTRYNMSGYGRFKRKFGGALTELGRWHKCYWRTARLGRRVYQLWFETRLHFTLAKVGPWLRRAVSHTSERAADSR